MRTALRTAIATAVVAGVAITPALAAGAAFAADGPATVKPAAARPVTATQTGAEAAKADAPTTKAPKTEAPKTAPATTAPATEAPATEAPKAEAAAGEGTGTYVRTLTLPNGVRAKIFKVADGHHRAELYREGRRVGTLDADHWSVAGNDNGQFFVLNSDGTTLSWVGNYLPGAKPGRYQLVDGTMLELAKKDGRYGIQELRWRTQGTGFAYLKEDRQVFHFNGAVVVLEKDGGFAAYVPGSARQAAPRPVTRDDDCTVHTSVGIGAGAEAELTMSPNGPQAVIRDIGSGKQAFRALDRTYPSLPKSTGIVARIDNPFGAKPTLYTKVEGGTVKGATHAFPAMPKGCKLNPVKGAAGANGNTGTGTNGSTGITVDTGGQTSVVPRGGVAAGAELGTESPASSTALYATGAGAASLAAAGLGFMVLRRRAAGSRA
ncbi:hypothetical protein [Streptomyces sp. NBC_00572]|uniref:hypothetical protein n=1 Tax=Streptomyces sp. NBC_00572 TaxID=2903664 RepID=UPI00225B2C11|nr:hypothetical protein [Streptomyces sp. NBC_00572]MCX4983040.1 hypothetical protein [Streptomyces sp. NBC_00572]